MKDNEGLDQFASGIVWYADDHRFTYLGVFQQDGLDFGRVLNEQTLSLRNTGTNAKSLSVRLLPSDSPPTPVLIWKKRRSSPSSAPQRVVAC